MFLQKYKDKQFFCGNILTKGVCNLNVYVHQLMYRVIHKSLRDFRPLQYSGRDGHAEGEHVNRKRDTSVSVLPYRCSIC